MNAEFFLILGAVIAVASAMSASTTTQRGGKTKRHRHRGGKSLKRRKY
jgi:hypothetical protein